MYHEDHPLQLSPGETREVIFNVQNMPGPENITVTPSVGQGIEILEIDSTKIFVPVGSSVEIKATVNIPIDAEIGDTYPVQITFTTAIESEAGGFGFGSSIGRNFDVIIVPTAEERAKLAEQKPMASWIIYLIAGIVILIILIIWLILRKRKE